jgi:hypothetical protein
VVGNGRVQGDGRRWGRGISAGAREPSDPGVGRHPCIPILGWVWRRWDFSPGIFIASLRRGVPGIPPQIRNVRNPVCRRIRLGPFIFHLTRTTSPHSPANAPNAVATPGRASHDARTPHHLAHCRAVNREGYFLPGKGRVVVGEASGRGWECNSMVGREIGGGKAYQWREGRG